MSGQNLTAADIGRPETLHSGLLDLCLRLEEVASDPTIAGELRDLTDAIPPLLTSAHDLEERLLFPDFDRHAGSCFAAMTVERLKAEHRYDRWRQRSCRSPSNPSPTAVAGFRQTPSHACSPAFKKACAATSFPKR